MEKRFPRVNFRAGGNVRIGLDPTEILPEDRDPAHAKAAVLERLAPATRAGLDALLVEPIGKPEPWSFTGSRRFGR